MARTKALAGWKRRQLAIKAALLAGSVVGKLSPLFVFQVGCGVGMGLIVCIRCVVLVVSAHFMVSFGRISYFFPTVLLIPLFIPRFAGV